MCMYACFATNVPQSKISMCVCVCDHGPGSIVLWCKNLCECMGVWEVEGLKSCG